jgi:predicted house-cleaning noncanonical NTP pyrophosphatase (MazG superfamily)
MEIRKVEATGVTITAIVADSTTHETVKETLASVTAARLSGEEMKTIEAITDKTNEEMSRLKEVVGKLVTMMMATANQDMTISRDQL